MKTVYYFKKSTITMAIDNYSKFGWSVSTETDDYVVMRDANNNQLVLMIR